MNRAIFTTIGFIIFALGTLSLILSMIGLDFTFMRWLDSANRLLGFLIKLAMAFGGIVIMALARTDWEQRNDNI